MYDSALKPSHWLASDNVVFNLKKLMTNAGFYLKNDDASLMVWVNDYYAALCHASLFVCDIVYPYFFKIQQYIYNSTGKFIDYYYFPKPSEFYQALAGKRVLFVSAFAEQISQSYQEKKLFNLYTDITIPAFELSTISAFISTWPNQPHGSWLETFNILKQHIDTAFKQRPFDLFFVSAGCYGIPLCRYVYQTYGCTAIYYGNYLNVLFGISQNCSKNFKKETRIETNWVKGNLASFPNMERIDKGRYI